MANALDGKVAVITGAASGIGAATARILVREGAKVVLGDINDAALKEAVSQHGANAIGCHVDVTKEDDIENLVQSALDSFGRLDILHNNAAAVIAEDTDAATATNAAWQTSFEMIVMAAVWGARFAIPAMLASDGGGSIINTSSGASQTPTGAKVAYGSCKAALETFTAYTGAQYGVQGIRSNAVRPGFVLTEGIRGIFDENMLRQVGEGAALGRICRPEDVGEVVAFLASDVSGYVNSCVINVDGGGAKPIPAW